MGQISVVSLFNSCLDFDSSINLFQTLGDANKRRDYDNYGYTTAQERPQRRQPDFGFPFDDFFGGGGGFKFGGGGFGGFGSQAESVVDKHLTTLR